MMHDLSSDLDAATCFFLFLGWSERLELQELYAGVREEKIEELSGDLVTCMTGEEGAGGEIDFRSDFD